MSTTPIAPADNPNVQGFLLLTVANVAVASTSPSYPSIPSSGLLSLECVTMLVSDPFSAPERDVWLVLRVNGSNPQQHIELVLPATQKILYSRADLTYTLPINGSGTTLTITLPAPTSPNLREDYETLEVILAQYAVLQIIAPPTGPPPVTSPTYAAPASYGGIDGDMKGRLVLVDEDNGQVIGSLAEGFNIHEDPNVTRTPPPGHEKDPVVIELGQDKAEGGRTGVFVHPITVDESDFLMKTAGLLSRGIVFATNVVSTGVTKSASYYVSHTEPNKEPIVFSETTRANVKRIHKVSGKAVQVTSKTTALIHNAVDKLADRVAGRDASKYANHPPPLPSRGDKGGLQPPPYSAGGSAPPPLPPRKKPRLLNRLLASTDLLLTTIESSAHHLVSHTTTSLSTALGHKYGPEMGESVQHIGDSMRNVGVVYIDARGVGRRALLRSAGKRIIFGGKGPNGEPVQHDVVFGSGPGVTPTSSPQPGPSRAQTMPPPNSAQWYAPPSGDPPVPGSFYKN